MLYLPCSRIALAFVIVFVACPIVRGARLHKKTQYSSLASTKIPPCPPHSELHGSACHCLLGFRATRSMLDGTVQQAEIINFDPTSGQWIGECQKRGCAMPYKYLLFEGGGAKGVAYGGLIHALEDSHILHAITGLSGSSAGSQIAALLAAGYSGRELVDILVSFDFKSLLDSGSAIDVWKRFGYYRGDALEKEIDRLLSIKIGDQDVTFEELYNASCRHWHGACKFLRIPAFCVNTGKLVWFDHVATPKVLVARAVRASSSIPLFFQPTSIEMPAGHRHLFADAALARNLPYDAFDTSPDGGALGFLLREPRLPVIEEFSSASQYIQQLAHAVTLGDDSINSLHHMSDLPGVDLVLIDGAGVDTVDFDLPEYSKADLLVNGYQALHKHLTECEQQNPGKTSAYIKIPAKPSWLHDLRSRSYTTEFQKRLHDAGTAFGDWWKQKGRAFFRPSFTGKVMKESEVFKDFNSRQVELISLIGGATLLMTHHVGTSEPRDVFLLSGTARREAGYEVKEDNETTRYTCVRMPLVKVLGKDLEQILDRHNSNATDEESKLTLNFCGKSEFAEHVCASSKCMEYNVLFQGYIFLRYPQKRIPTVVMRSSERAGDTIVAFPEQQRATNWLPYKFKEAYLVNHTGNITHFQKRFSRKLISHCVELPLHKIDPRLYQYGWQSSTIVVMNFCSSTKDFANALHDG